MPELNFQLPKQFYFTLIDDKSPLPPQWVRENILNGILSRSKSLPRIKLLAGNKPIGFILGWFIYNNVFYTSDNEVELNNNDVKQIYMELCGRFIIFTIDDDRQNHVYADPGALLSVVYSNKHPSVASTPRALGLIHPSKESIEIRRDIRRYDKTTWYPFGLVPFHEISRLLPGHNLCLQTHNTNRLIKSLTRIPKSLVEHNIQSIFDTVVSNVKSISLQGPICSHLTAGYDSRMVFAACLASNCDFQTVTISKSKNNLDNTVARKISCNYNIPHTCLTIIPPSKQQMNDWLDRTSYCIDDAVKYLCRTVEENDKGLTTLTGSCGEVGRAFYWNVNDIDKPSPEPETLVQRLGFELTPFILLKAEEWLNSLPSNLTKSKVYDFAYIENRLGGWAGPSVYGHNMCKPTISVFNQQSVYQTLLNLPETFLVNNYFAKSFISLCGHEYLLDIPFNKAQGISRVLHFKKELKAVLPQSIVAKIKFLKNRIL